MHARITLFCAWGRVTRDGESLSHAAIPKLCAGVHVYRPSRLAADPADRSVCAGNCPARHYVA